MVIVYIDITHTTLVAPYKAYKISSTEMINHSSVYGKVNMKEVSNLPKGMQEA